ncbi:hypothetical protein [Pseudomonas amygdali]|uniref:Uncharacterized protein n=2 Tax=Pseudomonas amygdali pv. lachrymans TaxID=53707 RepID=A0ABR5KS69_PSEAV|nr:hypothetical protein [Pseudomonas amygdali]AXH60270.1 hypothetical protein PLA107_034360 [Pseudomonas amygdali pv. lachrymans str. M301315]KPC17660.1 Uncharacterized protein AC499_0862 [Pseudomonas amygdali pv. lachrymans]
MKPPFPFPFAIKKRSDFSDPLKDFYQAIESKDLLKPPVIAELDQVHDSLVAMSADPEHAYSAMALEIKLVDDLHTKGTRDAQVKLPVIVFLLQRYHYLDYPVSAKASATLEAKCAELSDAQAVAAKELSLATARELVNDSDWAVNRQYLQWETDVRHPMFDKALPLAIYLVDPELLGIHKTEYERYFALRHTECAPKWKKLWREAEALLLASNIDHTPYADRIEDILSRTDWVRPREVQLALSMMNKKFNYAEVIEAWSDKAGMLDKLGEKLLAYNNKQPWIAPYAVLMAHLCHAMDLKGGHPSITSFIKAILLPQNLHREDAGEALRTLSSLKERLDPEGERLLTLATQMRELEPLSKAYYAALREEGFGAQAYRYLKGQCKLDKRSQTRSERSGQDIDSAKLIRLLKASGLDQYHRVSDKARDHAMSIDLGL